MIKIKMFRYFSVIIMVGPVGFEPTIAESESAALPLGDGPRFAICSIANVYIYMTIQAVGYLVLTKPSISKI